MAYFTVRHIIVIFGTNPACARKSARNQPNPVVLSVEKAVDHVPAMHHGKGKIGEIYFGEQNLFGL